MPNCLMLYSQIFRCEDLDRLLLRKRDFAIWGCGFVAVNSIVMVLWTILTPWQWTLTLEESTDLFGRSSSYYTCKSADGGHVYAILVVVFHASVLILGNWWSYRARELQTEYSESQYIGYALISELETIVL